MQALRDLPLVAEQGATLPLPAVSDINVTSGRSVLKTEDARPSGGVYVDIRGSICSGKGPHCGIGPALVQPFPVVVALKSVVVASKVYRFAP